MFGKKKCELCGEKLKKYNTVQLKDGCICGSCNKLSNGSTFATIQAVKNAWNENHRRLKEFKTDMTITNFGSGFIFIDTEHQYFYLSNSKKSKFEPTIFKFSEIDNYEIKIVGQKTITKSKSKGGIGRAVVGGALFGGVGAIVGASTAKKESITQEAGGMNSLTVHVSSNGLRTDLSLFKPPLETEKVMASMMEAASE